MQVEVPQSDRSILILEVPTVDELRAAGFKVRISHQRRFNNSGYFAKYSGINPKGGETRVLILAPAPYNYWGEGVVKCHQRDTYNKKIGYALAVARAIGAIPQRLGMTTHMYVMTPDEVKARSELRREAAMEVQHE